MTQAQARTLFRDKTNEGDTGVWTDAQIDSLIQRGLEALNRRVKYAFTDVTQALTASTQEYALPADCIEVVFVEWAGNLLQKTDTDELRRRETLWRTAAAGTPEFYYLYGRKLGLFRTPDAAAAATSLTIRYVSSPLDFTASGFDQIVSQDHPIPVYHAVYEFSIDHPNTLMALERSEQYHQNFEKEAQAAMQTYQRRLMAR